MGIEHEYGLVIGILYVLGGVEAEACQYGVGNRDSQRIEKVHFEIVACDPFQHTATGSCFEPLKVIRGVVRYRVCRRAEYRCFY